VGLFLDAAERVRKAVMAFVVVFSKPQGVAHYVAIVVATLRVSLVEAAPRVVSALARRLGAVVNLMRCRLR